MKRSSGLGGWFGRSSPERFESMTMWSLAFCFLLVPLIAVSASAWLQPVPRSIYLGTAILSAGLCGRAFLAHVGVYRGSARLRWPLIASAAVGIALFVVVVLWTYDDDVQSLINGLALAVAMTLALLVPVTTLRVLLIASAAAVAAAWLVAMVVDDELVGRAAAVVAASAAILTLIMLRASLWMLGVVWGLQDRREVDARLAVAEERLRFSRDLHDVYGRTLSAVAVKSELAAALAQRGADGAAAEMLDVRRIANDALRDVRAIVQGYRTADLVTELSGARSILRSAGIDVRVAGEELPIPAGAAGALAWAVREGVTNVVRHSTASECVLTLTIADGLARLTIDNDGASTGARQAGSGLRGLDERLARLGGAVRTERDGQRFRLHADVPLDAPVPTVPQEGMS